MLYIFVVGFYYYRRCLLHTKLVPCQIWVGLALVDRDLTESGPPARGYPEPRWSGQWTSAPGKYRGPDTASAAVRTGREHARAPRHDGGATRWVETTRGRNEL